MAKRGQKLSDQLKEQVKAKLVMNENKNDIARELDLSWSTVDKIDKEMKSTPEGADQFEKLRADKKQELIDALWDNIVAAQELGFQMIREARTGQRDIPLGQISTYLGTLYDKRALMNNESTSNSKIVVSMDGDIDAWAN